jgi:hypothetical protein
MSQEYKIYCIISVEHSLDMLLFKKPRSLMYLKPRIYSLVNGNAATVPGYRWQPARRVQSISFAALSPRCQRAEPYKRLTVASLVWASPLTDCLTKRGTVSSASQGRWRRRWRFVALSVFRPPKKRSISGVWDLQQLAKSLSVSQSETACWSSTYALLGPAARAGSFG